MRKRVPAIGLALGLALGGVGACARGGPAPDLRAPAMRGLASPSCGGCHEAERTAWDVSMHHASFSSEDFQSSYREEPSTFCVDCHAPLGRKLGTATAYAHGIGCESCHPASSEHAKGPVAVRATTSPCAPCHEFESERARTFLQSTEHEHRASRYRDTSCIDCHMARSDAGTRDHRFDVSRNPGVLSRALFVGAPAGGGLRCVRPPRRRRRTSIPDRRHLPPPAGPRVDRRRTRPHPRRPGLRPQSRLGRPSRRSVAPRPRRGARRHSSRRRPARAPRPARRDPWREHSPLRACGLPARIRGARWPPPAVLDLAHRGARVSSMKCPSRKKSRILFVASVVVGSNTLKGASS
jgi:hypothetical protein